MRQQHYRSGDLVKIADSQFEKNFNSDTLFLGYRKYPSNESNRYRIIESVCYSSPTFREPAVEHLCVTRNEPLIVTSPEKHYMSSKDGRRIRGCVNVFHVYTGTSFWISKNCIEKLSEN